MQAALPLLAVLLTGLGIALETPVNAMLTRSSGSAVWAALVSFLAGAGVLGLLLALLRPRLADGWTTAAPWWAWTGGGFGAAVVALSAWATPKLGAGTALVAIVAAQVALGVVLDHFGALGLQPHPAGGMRAAGVLVVVLGAVLVARG